LIVSNYFEWISPIYIVHVNLDQISHNHIDMKKESQGAVDYLTLLLHVRGSGSIYLSAGRRAMEQKIYLNYYLRINKLGYNLQSAISFDKSTQGCPYERILFFVNPYERIN
jgi:hypothetical protein